MPQMRNQTERASIKEALTEHRIIYTLLYIKITPISFRMPIGHSRGTHFSRL